MEEAFAGSSLLPRRPRRSDTGASSSRSRRCHAPGGSAFGYDDEGVPASRTPIIVDGVFQNFLSSRETAVVIGETSNATMPPTGGATCR